MYRLLTKAIEYIPAVRHESDLRVDILAAFVPDSEPGTHRPDDTPPAVSLTESKASWAGSDAFQLRWTSLVA